MDWQLAIDRNLEALKFVLAGLFAMAGLGSGRLAIAGHSSTWQPADPDGRFLPRYLHRAVLRLLRPAEAATRRLVIIAARSMTVILPPLRKRRPKRKPTVLRDGRGTGIVLTRVVPSPGPVAAPLPATLPKGAARPDDASGGGQPAARLPFPLFDPPRRFGPRRPARSSVPRISVPGVTVLFPVEPRRPPTRFDRIDATRLTSRLVALDRVLNDLPRQARRFALWQARRDAAAADPRPDRAGEPPPSRRYRRVWPLRAGRPPGSKRKSIHEVHHILREVHELAFWSLDAPDTS